MTKLPLLPCVWRGQYIGRGQYVCKSPNVVMHTGGPTAEVCAGCVYREAENIEEAINVPNGGGIRWGMTTAIRKEHKLLHVLGQLHADGIDPTVFCEPDVELPPIHLEVITNPCRYGVFRNWISSLNYLQAGQPDDKILGICQDDIQLTRNFLHKYLAIEWPEDAAVISPYCPTLYATGKGLEPAKGRPTWGACCLTMRAKTARQIIEYEERNNWPYDAQVDKFVGKALKEIGGEFYYVTPSLVQHIGVVSTLGDRPYSRNRRADDFQG